MTVRYDFIVVGGGIAGVSAAYELAAHGSVCLLEREPQLAYHTTGRSAAISMESYGNQQIRSLTYDEALEQCLDACETHGWYNRSTGINSSKRVGTQLRNTADVQTYT
ncbi:FAD-dependent oxidoreductase [Pseudomonas cucumis]|nr:FAD-dependent oxidoreductase [Pseudomonas cucumis]WLG89389.1 FAD-dependent oxidoreductase [Pseudomonas cucumis]